MWQQPIDYASPMTSTRGTKLRRLGAMHPAIAVALIAGGVILIVAPFFNNATWLTQEAALIPNTHGTPTGLSSPLPDIYTFACFCVGVLMIGIAVVGSIFPRTSSID